MNARSTARAAPATDRTDDPFRALADVFPASVTITRTSDQDCQARQLIVSIDDRDVATLVWGDSVRCDLQPGRHSLRVNNTLVWKTLDFTLSPGEQIFFEAINRTTLATWLVTAILGVGPLFLTVRRM